MQDALCCVSTTPNLFTTPFVSIAHDPLKVQRIETNPPSFQPLPDPAAPPVAPKAAKNIRRPLPPTTTEKTFRHAFWWARRQRVRQALEHAGATERRIEAFDCCGSGAMVCVDDMTGNLCLKAHHCHDRFCEACQHSRRQTVQRNLIPLVEAKRTLHVVLTPVSTDDTLKTCIDRLYRNAAKLRKTKFWQSRVAGGSQTLEITWNPHTRQWHPHLHLLVHAEWLQLQELSANWHAVTGDSHRVHVSLVKGTASATREVTKYLGKICHRSFELAPERMAEAITALKGTRLIATFGTWRGTRLLDVPKPAEPIIWRILMPLAELLERAARRETWAMLALAKLDPRHHHPTPDRGRPHDAAE